MEINKTLVGQFRIKVLSGRFTSRLPYPSRIYFSDSVALEMRKRKTGRAHWNRRKIVMPVWIYVRVCVCEMGCWFLILQTALNLNSNRKPEPNWTEMRTWLLFGHLCEAERFAKNNECVSHTKRRKRWISNRCCRTHTYFLGNFLFAYSEWVSMVGACD